MYSKLFFLIALNVFSIKLVSQSWQWTKSIDGPNVSEGTGVTSDLSGNVIVTGNYAVSATIGTTSYTSSGSSDFYISKYDPLGNLLWSRSYGGVNWDKSQAITCDQNGNIYITGRFLSPNITIGSISLNNPGWTDIFLIKFDSNGNPIWAKYVVGGEGMSLKTDNFGGVYITGDYGGGFTPTFGTTTLPFLGASEAFITKYDSNGNVLWAQSVNGPGNEHGRSVDIATNGNVYWTGSFESASVNIGGITLTHTISTFTTHDIFVAKFDPSGTVLWANKIIGSDNDLPHSISVDLSENAYITGEFASSTLTIGSTVLTKIGTYDYFIVKYDTNGNPVWAKSSSSGTNTNCMGYSVSTDTSGNLHVVGGFAGTQISFGSYTLLNTFGPTYDPMFIVKYDSNGNELCASLTPSGGHFVFSYVGVTGLCVNSDLFGNAYVTSRFANSPFIVGNDTLHITGIHNAFVTKFSCDTISPPNPSTLPCSNFNDIQIPNTFTPNNDGNNDVFYLENWDLCAESYKLTIYNRWGVKIFESENPNIEWDGRISSGSEATDGTYFYIFDIKNKNGQNERITGFIALLR